MFIRHRRSQRSRRTILECPQISNISTGTATCIFEVFYDFDVWNAHKHREKLGYIHQACQTRVGRESSEQWRWISF